MTKVYVVKVTRWKRPNSWFTHLWILNLIFYDGSDLMALDKRNNDFIFYSFFVFGIRTSLEWESGWYFTFFLHGAINFFSNEIQTHNWKHYSFVQFFLSLICFFKIRMSNTHEIKVKQIRYKYQRNWMTLYYFSW